MLGRPDGAGDQLVRRWFDQGRLAGYRPFGGTEYEGPRRITPESARALLAELPPRAQLPRPAKP